MGPMPSRTSIECRFWTKVVKGPGLFDCWLWVASLSHHGYGRFWDGNRMVKAHRFAYKLLVGPIPDGLELDHVLAWGCTNRHCVNPSHLESVTGTENIRRGDCTRFQSGKTHCPAGHPYDEANTYRRCGSRYCRTCRRTRKRKALAT